MRLENKTNRTLQHSEMNKDNKLVIFNLKPNQNLEVPDKIAEKWLKYKGVVKYVDPEKAEKAKADAAKKQKELEDENAKLKAEIEQLKAEAKKVEGNELETLKAEATALGVEFAPNIGIAKLKEKIEAKKAEQQ